MTRGSSQPERLPPGARAALVLAVLALSPWGCASPGALPSAPPLRDTRIAPRVPDAVDHAAADVAAAALVGDAIAAATASEAIARADATRPEGATGLLPAAQDLYDAVAHPGREYRAASRELLRRHDVEPELRERIERSLEDDPLVRADARVHDARVKQAARAFNALAEPVGQSLLDVAAAPLRLGRSLLHYGLVLYREDPLPLERRQALAYWKDFLERYPHAPESPEVAERAADAEVRWHQTQRKHALAEAERALDGGHPREALVLAERALRHSPEHAGAERVRAEAQAELLRLRKDRRRSVGFALPEGRELAPRGTRELAVAILAGGPPPDAAASTSEARFARAGWLLHAGDERAAWQILRELAEADPDEDNMARHAQAALADPVRNAYGLFEQARSRDRRTRALWVAVGPLPDHNALSTPDGALQALLEVPRMVQTVATFPLRLLRLPFMDPPKTAKTTAVEARRYLEVYPSGVHADEVAGWLEDYESARDNHLAALRIAEKRDPDGDHTELREKAARQTLIVAQKEQRRDLRLALLTGVTRRFPETAAGDEAGRQVRRELDEYTPHHIRITRGFLEENPELAGVHGFDLDPTLLDGDARNGELHPDGLSLVGGRVVEIAYVGPDGDPKDPPETRRVHLSEEHLARVVACLEETSFENALQDEEDPVRPDAERDLVFERARLGLSGDVDDRPTASATFTYTGMRERYGVVRRREPLLPFDIVVRGSLADLSLGAFPRMRVPQPTEDSLLYQ